MKLSNDIVVVGAGGHAKVVIATIRAAGGDVAIAYDDDQRRWGQTILGVEIRGPISRESLSGTPAIIAIGDNRARKTLAERIDASWVTACHPTAVIHPTASIGPGTVVFAGCIVQPETTIGAHAILNTSSSVDHDCDLGDFVHVGPGARICGGVRLEEGVLLGVGTKIAPSVQMAAWSTAGAGAVCVADVMRDATVVGVPARPIEAGT